MTPFSGGGFDPFLHEIVEVEQADHPAAPIEVTEVLWPGLMLGELLFSRAGVRVRAGAAHARRGAADRSPLYRTFRRRHRRTVDLSQGLGRQLAVVDGPAARLPHPVRRPPERRRRPPRRRQSRAGARPPGEPEPPGTAADPPRERRDLLRHRCLLRTPEAVAELDRDAPWDREFIPFDRWLPAAEE
ncbi:hypothetical protein [Kitasatospora sp. NPDC093679]|uniref:hypothetical protein n=1 Tax=Kitasatospora sp. NPDC093679 TaxID=3154983 RepID=UPI0034465B32